MAELKKMDLTSASGASINLEALYQICPSAFTEVRDEKTRQIERKINFTTLRELLGDNAYEGADEEYGFNWVGKRAAQQEAGRPINKTLRPCPEESEDWENTQNLYIEGDNLDVLKLLQKSYLGAIKMIYIDPPYNTGNDFVYRDDFAMSKDEYDVEAGNTDELGNRYRRNTDSNLRFHSVWCSMIYERLMVARSLLTPDGVIFISIDDCEQRNMRFICDEVFGEENFITQVVWQKIHSIKNDAKYFSENHEYALVYSNNKIYYKVGLLPRTEAMNQRYKNPDNDPRGPWQSGDLVASGERSNGHFIVISPKTGKQFDVPQGKHWVYSEDNLKALVEDNQIWFGEDGNSFPRKKRFLTDVQDGRTPSTIWLSEDVGHNQTATREVKQLFEDNKFFDFPKPVSYIKQMLQISTSSGDIILDFFSGSATTAHAVMQLNAEDNGKRKFIMVQIPEETEDESEARKAGYLNICDIGKARIYRAAKKIKQEAGLMAKDLDTGFRVFKLDESNMQDVYFAPSALSQGQIEGLVDNVKPDRTDLDLLFGCMLDWGVQLSLPLSKKEVNGKAIHIVNDGELVACFADCINEDIINAIAELNPLRVVFKDSGFESAPLKINLFEMFKQKCGWSEENVTDRVRII